MMEKEELKNPPGSPSSGSEDTEDEEERASKISKLDEAGAPLDKNVLKKRREKRLAMNRASARARRKRKKELLSSLAAQVQELTSKNEKLQNKNDSLSNRVEQLQSALSEAKQTITTLSNAGPAVQALPLAGAVTSDLGLRSLLLGGGAAGLGGAGLYGDTALLNARAVQQLELQNQLRLLNATSGLGAAATGLGGLQASVLQQQAVSDRLLAGSVGVSGLGRGGLGLAGVAPTASQLELAQAKAISEEQGTANKASLLQTKVGEDDAALKISGASVLEDAHIVKKALI